MSDQQPADIVWQRARQRVLAAFDRQRKVGIETHGIPLPVSIPGMDMADERLYELVDAIIYETADQMHRAELVNYAGRLHALVAHLEGKFPPGHPDHGRCRGCPDHARSAPGEGL